MRIKSVVLDHHCDVTILGGYVIYQFVADVKLAVRNLFQTCDHTQGSGFSAAGGTNQNDELFVFDVQRDPYPLKAVQKI
jgi:hypothetical protein